MVPAVRRFSLANNHAKWPGHGLSCLGARRPLLPRPMPLLVARRAACRALVVSVAASESHHATREPRHEFGDASTASAQPGDPVGRAQRQPKPCSLGPPRGARPSTRPPRRARGPSTRDRTPRSACPSSRANRKRDPPKKQKAVKGATLPVIYPYARTENFGPARYRSYDDVARRRWVGPDASPYYVWPPSQPARPGPVDGSVKNRRLATRGGALVHLDP